MDNQPLLDFRKIRRVKGEAFKIRLHWTERVRIAFVIGRRL